MGNKKPSKRVANAAQIDSKIIAIVFKSLLFSDFLHLSGQVSDSIVGIAEEEKFGIIEKIGEKIEGIEDIVEFGVENKDWVDVTEGVDVIVIEGVEDIECKKDFVGVEDWVGSDVIGCVGVMEGTKDFEGECDLVGVEEIEIIEGTNE